MANLINILPGLFYVRLINEEIRAQTKIIWNNTNMGVSSGFHFTEYYVCEIELA